jgi:putative heme-binding domain-containing protein
LAEWLRGQLAMPSKHQPSDATPPTNAVLETMLIEFAGDSSVQQLLAETVVDSQQPTEVRRLALGVMARANLSEPPPSWRGAVATVIHDSNADLVLLAVAAARELTGQTLPDAKLNEALLSVADEPRLFRELRVTALAAVSSSVPELGDEQFQLLVRSLSANESVALRSAAADALSQAHLTSAQLERLCGAIKSAGPLELNRLVTSFQHATDERLGIELLASLKSASALTSLRMDVVRATLSKYSPRIQKGVEELESLVNIDAATQRQRIEDLLPHVGQGDVRRGHAVFYSSKAACSACHRLGYAGGTIGPDLSNIGEIRTERDLLEAVLFPSLSLVRSYEPVLIVTTAGRTISGTILEETEAEYLLATGPEEKVHVRHDEVDQIQPSLVSIMPAGLDKQFTAQELADLIAFLKHATN